MALFTSDLSRDGPGLLLQDIRKGDDPQITATIDILVEVSPDIVVLAGFDYDHGGTALGAFSDALNDAGLDLGHRYAAHPNSGLMTDLDLDGNDRFGEPRDAQGYGTFSGDNGMAILSRWAVVSEQAKDFSDLVWRDIPNANLPIVDGALFPNSKVYEVQRLSSTAHWDVPVALPNGQVLHLLTHYATPPVFDGPEDRNGRRNADELGFWSHYLTGAMGPAPTTHYVLPPIIAAIRLAEPGIAIELVPSDESENLLFREADIALRMYRPTQLDVVTQHIGDMALGLFGSRDYLARTTKPESLEDMMALDLVGHDREERLIHGLRERGFDATRDWFKTRVDNPTVYWELVRAGCGVGFTLSKVGRADPDMIEIPTGIEIEPLPLWLTSHEAMRHTPRIRRVWTLLAEQLVQVIRDDAKT